MWIFFPSRNHTKAPTAPTKCRPPEKFSWCLCCSIVPLRFVLSLSILGNKTDIPAIHWTWSLNKISVLLDTILFSSCPFIQLSFIKEEVWSECGESSIVYKSEFENYLHFLALHRSVNGEVFVLAFANLRSELFAGSLTSSFPEIRC